MCRARGERRGEAVVTELGMELAPKPRSGPLRFDLGVTFVRSPQITTAIRFDDVVFDVR